jgi:putative nucleotidyltransferase-like protein
MADLDLLVKPTHTKQAFALMCSAGWSDTKPATLAGFYEGVHHHLPPLDDANGTGLGLEIHSAITPRAEAIQLSGESIWKSARAVELKGRHTFVPATHHQIVHLAVHFAWSHGITRSVGWRTFRDLHHIAAESTIDWDETVRCAEQARARTCCYWTLRLARALTDLLVPEEILKSLRPPRSRPAARLLERHFTSSMFATSKSACPSVRLNDWLWSVAIAPRWSGHGNARPWDQSAAWHDALGTQSPQSLSASVLAQFARLRNWATYLHAVLLPPQFRT